MGFPLLCFKLINTLSCLGGADFMTVWWPFNDALLETIVRFEYITYKLEEQFIDSLLARYGKTAQNITSCSLTARRCWARSLRWLTQACLFEVCMFSPVIIWGTLPSPSFAPQMKFTLGEYSCRCPFIETLASDLEFIPGRYTLAIHCSWEVWIVTEKTGNHSNICTYVFCKQRIPW